MSLFAAARNGNCEALQHLLQTGFNVNERFNNDRSALHFACDGGQLPAATLLLKFGADVNMQDLFNKDTPLHICCEKGHTTLAHTLLQSRANPNVADQLNGETPLHLACEGGHLDLVRMLLDAHADPRAQNVYHKSPFFYAPPELRSVVGFNVNGEQGKSDPADVAAHASGGEAIGAVGGAASTAANGSNGHPAEGGRQGPMMQRASAVAAASQFRMDGDVPTLEVKEWEGGVAVHVTVGAYSQAGEDVGGAAKANQDSYFYLTSLGEDAGLHIAGVFDGHGRHGHMVSQFCRNRFANSFPVDELKGCRGSPQGIEQIFHRMFLETQQLLERQNDFDAQGSGTTAVVILVVDGVIYSANCGDSRAVLGRRQRIKGAPHVTPVALTADHTPDVSAERDRITAAGGVVKRDEDEFTGEQGPWRVWRADHSGPGLAMSRSLGDLGAHRIGVSAAPEVTRYKLEDDDAFVMIASDGIWDMIPNQSVIECAYEAGSMLSSACQQLHDVSREAWKLKENRVDDITGVLMAFKYPQMLYAL